MLMIVTDTQILAPQQVCCGCLLANREGQPRWQSGELGCGHRLRYHAANTSSDSCPEQYECEMGFRLALIH